MKQDFLLIWKMKNGDEAAIDAFVRRYYAQILQYCSYHCADRTWAEDLTQETFERFFRKLADYKHQGKTLNYLYTIARNLCIDWSRKRWESVERGVMSVEKSYDVSGAESEIDQISQRYARDETVRVEDKLLIESALERLPQELSEIVILHYFQELSLRETAEVLSVGLPLVKYRLGRAKVLLRELLGEDETERKSGTPGRVE